MINDRERQETCYHKIQLLIVLLSVLLHLMFLVFFLCMYRLQQHSAVDSTSMQQDSIVLLLDDEPWASTNSSYTQQHMQPAILHENHRQDIHDDMQPTMIQNEQEIVETRTENADSVQDPLLGVTSTVVENPLDQPGGSQEEKLQQDTPDTLLSTTTVSSIELPIAHDERIKAAAQQKQPVEQQVQPNTNAQPMHAATTSKTQQQQRAQRFMASLAASFVHAARDEQEHVVTIIADSRRMPTEEQITRERYIARLQQCFYTSCVAMRSYAPRISGPITHSIISMYVHRDGSVSRITLEKASNNPAVDQFHVSAFLDASRSFPPLPSHFPKSFYIFRWIISTS
jgi:outer membrane biosynthesis protein TonB